MEGEEKKPSNPNAFPSTWDSSYNAVTQTDFGMPLRDYFAAKAMQGICVNAGRNEFSLQRVEPIIEKAYELADAMLKQREL